MSLKENSRYLSFNDSSIPILRKIHRINKKSKTNSPLPEISKCIETIITSSGGYQEISDVSYKKMPSHKKHTKDRRKNEAKAEDKLKQKLVEATRTCEKRSKLSIEDLRLATKRRKTEKVELSSEIKILKKLYPNPYELEKVDEFKILKSIKESKEKLQETLPLKLSLRTEEKLRRTPGGLAMSKLPALIKSMTQHRSSTSISTISQSSLKQDNDDKISKSKVLNSKIFVIGSTHLRQASAHINPDNIKLQTTKNRSQSKSKEKSQELVRQTTQDLIKSSPRVLSRIYEYKKLQHLEDLQQIYEIMNKVTESYLKITSKVIDIKYASLLDKSSTAEMITVNRSIKQKQKTKVNFSEPPKKSHKSEKQVQKEIMSKENSKEVDTTIVSSQIVLLEPKIKENNFFNDADFMKTTQKIDEVLEFMYKFIQNFSTKETAVRNIKKKQPGKIVPNQKTAKPPLSLPLKSKTPKTATRENKQQEDVCHIRSSTHIGRSSKSCSPESPQVSPRPRGRRRQGAPCHTSRTSANATSYAQQVPRLESILSPSSSTNRYPNIRCESSELIMENEVQTVEGQNELGGCNENVPPNGEIRLPKPITPLSVKPKQSNAHSCKVIKSALEIEEKLLADLVPKTSENKCNTAVDSLVPNESFVDIFVPKTQARTWSFFNLKPRTSNFVLCINSLPPPLRTNIRKRIPRPCFSVMFNDSRFQSQQVPPIVKEILKEVSVAFDGKAQAREHAYVLREEPLSELLVVKTQHLSMAVSFSNVCNVSQTNNDYSLKSSESLLLVEIVRPKEIVIIESFMEPVIEFKKSCHVISEEMKSVSINMPISLPPKTNSCEIKKDKSVEQMQCVVKEAEESILEIEEKKSDIHLGSVSVDLPNPSQISLEKDTDTKKIYELLLRTQNLQTKLRLYLNKMSSLNPVSLPSRFLNETEKPQKQETKDSQNSTSSLINWCEKSVSTSKHMETNHDFPLNDTLQNVPVEKTLDEVLQDQEAEDPVAKEENAEDKAEVDKDDRSSVCSFKSSIDYSETNETLEEIKSLPKLKNEFKSMTMFKKFFNDVDVFKSQVFRGSKDSQLIKEGPKIQENENKSLEIVKNTPTSDPKALKTIFKGKESVTELSIGFKGVNKINNISVEKKKYSPNHTKLSICIFKESSEALQEKNNHEQSANAITNGAKEKEISTYYLDNFKPSISSSLTECSRVEEISNRSFELRKSDSDEEEDDFKSVASTLSDTELSKKIKNQRKEDQHKKVNRSGYYRKHRFEFYQKMEPRLEEAMFKSKYKAGPYKMSGCKELEPVQQALTDLQMRMRSIRKDSFFTSTRYYKKALKLAKMSAGYCQTCGNRSVIPDDTFGLYKTILPRRQSNHHNCCYVKTSSPNTSYYSFCAAPQAMSERYCDLSLKQSSTYLHKVNQSVLGNSFHEVPVYWERI